MMSDNKQESEKRETVADIVAMLRANARGERFDEFSFSSLADRIDAAWKRERELLRSCARWILTHDIYGHMAQELLAECKKVLGDYGRFLTPKGDMA